jgi:hypothetical protein
MPIVTPHGPHAGFPKSYNSSNPPVILVFRVGNVFHARFASLSQLKSLMPDLKSGSVIGVLLTLSDPTTTMRREASSAGFYESPLHGKFEKIQILTIEDIFDGKQPHLPWIDPSVFKKAKREKTEHQAELDV